MKKFFLISILMGALPLSMVAQDDDLYFVPKKKSEVKVTDKYGMPKDTYYSGSSRSVDEYNRRGSSYQIIDADSTMSDVISFDGQQGVYPDSTLTEDFALTKKMQRFDDYDLSDNAAFWAGYERGRSDWGWGWHSPWYYRNYGWYGGWYDPWYYGSSWSWYDPFYWDYAYWYNPLYGRYWYWGYPYYYDRYYSYGWYHPYYYGGGGGGRHYAWNGNTGTINRDGSTRGGFSSYHGNLNSSRTSSLRNRTVGNHRAYGGSSTTRSGNYGRSGNSVRSNSGNFSGSRSGSYSSGSSSRSSSGSFSGGGGGGSTRSSGGGGGGRSGGGSLGGRR